MIRIEIPGYETLELEYLVMDYNGTLAIDGRLIEGVGARLRELSKDLSIHIITADTFGLVKSYVSDLPVTLKIIHSQNQAQQKQEYVKQLDANKTIAIGNGRNDRLMVEEARLGIATLQAEGAATETIQSTDIVVADINAALDLIIHPLRLKATLRD